MQRLHHFSLDAIAPTPWKNGGGTTREIVCLPSAPQTAFDWRVGIATIDAAGPFSPFPGVDRTIILLDGAGVRLEIGGMVDHILDKPLIPFSFSGDSTVHCEPLGASATGFNVMTRRDIHDVEVYVIDETCDIAPAPNGVLFAVGGAWTVSNTEEQVEITARHGGWWKNAPHAWRASPYNNEAKLIVVRILEAHPL